MFFGIFKKRRQSQPQPELSFREWVKVLSEKEGISSFSAAKMLIYHNPHAYWNAYLYLSNRMYSSKQLWCTWCAPGTYDPKWSYSNYQTTLQLQQFVTRLTHVDVEAPKFIGYKTLQKRDQEIAELDKRFDVEVRKHFNQEIPVEYADQRQ